MKIIESEKVVIRFTDISVYGTTFLDYKGETWKEESLHMQG